MVLQWAARQILPVHLAETRVPLISSCSDPLCVVSAAIKQSSLFVAHMCSEGEVLMKYGGPFSAATELDMLLASVHLQNLSLSHPQIPVVTSFSLTAHHLLTHRLTSLTLQREGVAASMKR